MNLPASLLPEDWLWLGWLLAFGSLFRAIRAEHWRKLSSTQVSSWLAASLLMMLLWQLNAHLKPGLNLHLLGATLLTLIAGPHRALLGVAGALGLLSVTGHHDFASWGMNVLLMGEIPVWLTSLALRLARRYLPPNFFVYIFINGFLMGAVSQWLVNTASACLLAGAGAYDLSYLLDEHLPYAFLLGWSEAFTTGFLATLLVIYRPTWVSTFDDTFYLFRREP